jgi:hypothetical protein
MNPRGVQVALPAAAVSRLDQLTVERDSALDAARSLQQRINLADADSNLYTKLMDQRLLQDRRHNTWARLLSSTNQFLFQLRLNPGESLVPVKAAVKPDKGQTAQDAITKLRAEIAAAAAELSRTRSAPLPAADLIKLAEEYVANRCAVNGPRISVVHGVLSVTWPDDVIADKQGLLGVLCWLASGSVINALKREIEVHPAAAHAMPPADKLRRVTELEARLRDLEDRESALLDDADGVLPRPDMSPLAWLQIRIAAREAAAA